MLAFWEAYWLYSLLFLALLLVVWAGFLLIATSVGRLGEGYAETPLERLLSRYHWIAKRTKFAIPRLESMSSCASSLTQRHRLELERIDTATRVMFAPATLLGQLLFFAGGLQALWTLISLGTVFSPWETLSISAFMISIVPFLLTIGTFQRTRDRRMPFELRFLESASWALHQIKKDRSDTKPGFIYGQLRDVERIPLSRYQDRELARLPRYAIATANWMLNLAPLLESRADLLARTTNHVIAQNWVDEAFSIVCRPQPTANASNRQRHVALAATRAKPKNVFAVSGLVFLISALAGMLGLLVSLEFNLSPVTPADVPDYLGAAAAVVAIIGTLATLLLTLVERMRRPSRHLVELMLHSET